MTENLQKLDKDGNFDYRWGVIKLVMITLKWDVLKTILYG